MKEDIRQRIIESGARIIHLKGFHHTGIQEILDAAGIPKGSFYFYFKNKNDFGLQIIDYFDNMYRKMVENVISDERLPPLKKIEGILDFFIRMFSKAGFKLGCPVGNLAQELGDLDEQFRVRLNCSLAMIREIYRELIKEAQDTGTVSKQLDAAESAAFIVSSWHGALIHMKVAGNAGPLELHTRMVLSMLGGYRSTSS